MVTFAELEPAAPSIAAFFRQRIEVTGLSLVATTRSDGWPRVSAWEAFLADGRLYMGSMPNVFVHRRCYRSSDSPRAPWRTRSRRPPCGVQLVVRQSSPSTRCQAAPSMS